MYRSIRTTLLITAFAATVAGVLTTALPGQTREISHEEACASAAWPQIPAGCLEGGRGVEVRFVTVGGPSRDTVIAARFDEAFQ